VKVGKSSDNQAVEESQRPHLGRLILQAYRTCASKSIAKLRERGYTQITLAHTALLANLDPEGTWITTLAERACMTKQSMRQLAVDLEKQGYIKRTIDPQDKRATLVTFTEAGWQLLGDVEEIKQQMHLEYRSLLGDEQMQTIEAGLLKLINGVFVEPLNERD
jgi:DNA-binding MarR family transcriptional regulator